MPVTHVKAAPQVRQLLTQIKEKHHSHLDEALVAVEFVDSKPYVKDRLNLGRVTKFSKATQLWFPDNAKYDFLISLCADVWFGILNEQQREALLDLHLTRCQVEYEPNSVVVNGKKQVVKDEWGRVEYTDQVKTDDAGLPIWKVSRLDMAVVAESVKRYGIWFQDLLDLKNAMDSHVEG